MVPMTPEVGACFRKILEARAKPKIEPIIGGHSGFLFLDKNGMNPKTLQYIIGHSHISVTLNTYTHVSFEDAQAEVKRMSAG